MAIEIKIIFLFLEDSPPSILIKIPSGSASIEPGGELVVFPGSTVHFECVFSRRLGSPDWTWTSPLGQYLTGKIVNVCCINLKTVSNLTHLII